MKNTSVITAIAMVCAVALGAFVLQKTDAGENTVVRQQVDAPDVGHAHGASQAENGHGDHDGHDEKDGHGHESLETDEHGDHDGHGEEVVRISDAELEEFDIRLATAKPGALDQYIELPGEIVLNADRIAHVVPRVGGIVREVRSTVGDRITAGQLLAVLESRELADAKAAYLATVERLKLAEANFQREERLWEKKVTSEQEYLDARQALAETKIERNSTEQQLHALGISDDLLKDLPAHPDATYTRFEVRAPLNGTIIEKHITLGENVSADADVFTIADLTAVWVNLNVYQKDLVSIRKGQSVLIEIGHGIPSATGLIAWVGPQVDEATRTAKARVELANPDGNFRPGLFVTAKVAVGSFAAGLVVPKSALQTFEGKTVIFVRTDEGFEPRPVEVGRQSGTTVEILAGLAPGQTYVSQGAFTLKAQLSKGAFGDGHNH